MTPPRGAHERQPSPQRVTAAHARVGGGARRRLRPWDRSLRGGTALLATERKEASSTASSGTVSTSTTKLMVDVKDSSKNSESTLHGPALAHRSRWRKTTIWQVFEVWFKDRLATQVC